MREYVMLALKSIRNRKVRSYLTMIGIIIGATTFIALITLGNGLETGMTERFDKFGLRRLFIGPKITTGFSGPPTGLFDITERDAETVRKLPGIEYVTPILGESVEVKYGREEFIRTVYGMGLENMDKFFEDIDIGTEAGRLLEKGDRKVAFIGWGIAHELFNKEIPVKAAIYLNDEKYRVIGIKERQGLQNEDFTINIPLEDMQALLETDEGISAFVVTINKGVDVEYAAERVERALERARDDENFQVTSPVKIKEQTGILLSLVTLVVTAIAAISLIVGGLGIMNSMYSSVLERTKEIGVMKALGARNKDILLLFLFESGFMGLVGGTLGILLGLGISFGLAGAINQFGFVRITLTLSQNLIIFSLLFSFILGMISGILPAYQASKMKPVDALRYE